MFLIAAQPGAWSKLIEPAAAHAPVLAAAGLVAGLVVLVAGGKLVRGWLICAGLAGGAGLGYAFAPSVFSQPDLWGVNIGAIGAVIGGVAGAGLASILFRTAATAASAASLAALGVLIASVCFAYSTHDVIVPASAAAPAAQAWADSAAAGLTPAPPLDQTQAPTIAHQIGVGIEAVASATGQLAQSMWEAATPDGRLYIAGGAAAGVLVGLLLGVLSPRRAMATTTALAGAGLSVGCLAVLGPHLGIDTAGAGTDRVALWAFAGLASLGIFVQWASLRTPRRLAARAPAAA